MDRRQALIALAATFAGLVVKIATATEKKDDELLFDIDTARDDEIFSSFMKPIDIAFSESEIRNIVVRRASKDLVIPFSEIVKTLEEI